jgi:hypothetical protein
MDLAVVAGSITVGAASVVVLLLLPGRAGVTEDEEVHPDDGTTPDEIRDEERLAIEVSSQLIGSISILAVEEPGK